MFLPFEWVKLLKLVSFLNLKEVRQLIASSVAFNGKTYEYIINEVQYSINTHLNKLPKLILSV